MTWFASRVHAVHPIERLRYVARSSGGDPRMMVHETASALRGLGLDAGGVVLACRRIVERHPTCGPLWWLSAHLMVAGDPFEATRRLAEFIVEDPTAQRLADALPDDATVCVIGWPDLTAEALERRGDVRSLVVDTDGEGEQLVRRLQRQELDSVMVEAAGVAGAVLAADVVLVEPVAVGGDAMLVRPASHAAAAVAHAAGRPVWAVLPRGRCLPPGLWGGVLQRWEATGDPWERAVEAMSWRLVSHVVTAEAASDVTDVVVRPDCPDTLELLRSSAM